jgi:hypothetical protein
MVGEIIAWMEQHEKLAGWAQAVGAALAIVAAFLVAHLQARSVGKQAIHQTAERIRSLAMLFRHWRDICLRSYEIREHEGEKPDVLALNFNLGEFNHTAGEINKFSFGEAPNPGVLRVLVRYREMCGPLSQYMNPEYKAPLPADELKAFRALLSEIERLAESLMVEAGQLDHSWLRRKLLD